MSAQVCIQGIVRAVHAICAASNKQHKNHNAEGGGREGEGKEGGQQKEKGCEGGRKQETQKGANMRPIFRLFDEKSHEPSVRTGLLFEALFYSCGADQGPALGASPSAGKSTACYGSLP